MKSLMLLLALCCSYLLNGQSKKTPITWDPDEILQRDYDAPTVLLVGSFHFAYYGLDEHVTKEDDKVNVLLPSRQKEMKELVEYIAKFKPNKIAIEAGRNSAYVMVRYRDYLEDPSSLRANEIDQITFPLMKKFGLDTLYGTNTYGIARDLHMHKDSLTFRPFLDSIWRDEINVEDRFEKLYNEFYDYDDKLALEYSLLEYFKFMNSDISIDRGFGDYLVGAFKNGKYEGADGMVLNWYSRNLRIYRNIQNITQEGDRILVLYGAGHLTILKNLFECSPEYDLVKFNDLD